LIAADVFAALPTLIWLYIFKAQADHYSALRHYGYSGEWDGAVYFPLAMLVALLIALAAFNFITRQPGMIALVVGAAMLPIFPYGMMMGGGV
jgi:hypothetical protein